MSLLQMIRDAGLPVGFDAQGRPVNPYNEQQRATMVRVEQNGVSSNVNRSNPSYTPSAAGPHGPLPSAARASRAAPERVPALPQGAAATAAAAAAAVAQRSQPSSAAASDYHYCDDDDDDGEYYDSEDSEDSDIQDELLRREVESWGRASRRPQY